MSSAHRILVVEDEPVLAQNVRTFLSRRSPDVHIAADGRRAMEMVAAFAPDVVVLDYRLPGEDGLQIYREIMHHRARPFGCVMINGYTLEKISPPAKKLGIHYVLGKPFSLAELQQLIDQCAEEASRASH